MSKRVQCEVIYSMNENVNIDNYYQFGNYRGGP
jgi:hypothetical protein